MGGLTLLSPWGLLALAGALPIVALYILKARRRKVKVPSSWLWVAAQKDLQARAPWKRLQRELPLILELTALALLAFGLAGPACRGRTLKGKHVAIVLDLSGSMDTRDDRTQRSRTEEAKRAAERVVDGLAGNAEAMLVGAGRDARVLFPLGRDRRSLRAAIQGASPLEVEGELSQAVALAVDRLRPLGGQGRVVIVTDGATGRVESLRTGPVPLEVVRIGHPQDNAAIIRMDVRTARQEGHEGEVVQAFALLANFGEREKELFVTARRDGEQDVVASRRLRVGPGAREPVVLTFPLAPADAGRGLLVELEPRDALAVDDVAYGRIPPGTLLPVVLVSRNTTGPWVRRALESDPYVQLIEGTEAGVRTAPPGALLVYEGLCPAELPTEHDVLVFSPPRGRCSDVEVLAPIDAPEIGSYANTDARFRFLTMDGVHLAHATPLVPGPRATGILQAEGKTLIADASTPERSVTIVGLDVGDTDWPLKASFPLFVRNVEEMARGHRARAITGGGHTGEPLRVPVPTTVRTVEVRGPAGTQRVSATAGTAIVGETSRAGLYHLAWPGGSTVAPINLLSDAESNLRSPPLRVDGSPAGVDVRNLVKPHEELAPWLAMIAALVLLANLVWLTRRESPPSNTARKGSAAPATTGGAANA